MKDRSETAGIVSSREVVGLYLYSHVLQAYPHSDVYRAEGPRSEGLVEEDLLYENSTRNSLGLQDSLSA